MALTDKNQKIDCFRRALQINPNNSQVKAMLERLQPAPPPAESPPADAEPAAPAPKKPTADWLTPLREPSGPAPDSNAASPGPTGQPQPAAAQKQSTAGKVLKKNRLPLIIAAVSLAVLTLVCVVGAYLTYQTFIQSAAEVAPLQATVLAGMATLTMPPEATPSPAGFVLPPTWTPPRRPHPPLFPASPLRRCPPVPAP